LPKVEYLQQIQENLNKSDFCFGALSQQFLQSEYITTQEIPHFLQQKSLFLFGLDKRIDGKGICSLNDEPESNCCIVQITTSLPPITGFLLSNNRLKH
jgi:hypothetical protein